MMHVRLLRLSPVLVVVLATLGFRIALTVPQWIGAHSFVLETGVPPNIPLDFVSFPGLWARWDSGNYLAIVIQGYADTMQRVFMPLYPVLMWVGALGHFEWILWSGWLISCSAFLGAVALLWDQVKQDHGETVANIMVILLNVFPLSFFFSALYSESLFYLLFALAYVCARREKWFWCAVCVALASITRINGILIGVIPVIEILQRNRGRWFTPQVLSKLVLVGVVSMVGLLLVMAYFYSAYGNPIEFLTQQTLHYHRSVDLPWVAWIKTLRIVLTGYGGFETNKFLRLTSAFDLVFITFFGILVVVSFKRMNLSLATYGAAILLMTLCQYGPAPLGFWSGARYTLPIFSGFVVMAQWLAARPKLQPWVYAVSLIAQVPLILWFASGRWVS